MVRMLSMLSMLLCCMVAIGLIGVVGIPAAPLCAEEASLTATGIWVEGAALIQASGLTSDGSGGFWTVGDQNTGVTSKGVEGTIAKGHKGNRLFRIKIIAAENGKFTAALLPESHKIDTKEEEYVGDFEGVCAVPGSDRKNTLFAVTEQTYDNKVKNKGLDHGHVYKIEGDGTSVSHFAKIALTSWFAGDTNEKLEGIACDGQTLFLAYEKPAVILSLPLEEFSKSADPKPIELIKLRSVTNVNGLEYFKDGDNEYLLAISRNDNRLLAIPLIRDEGNSKAIPKPGRVKTLDITFNSPNGKPMHWASPEGVAFDERGLWLISDPAFDKPQNYSELGSSPAKRGENFKKFVPLLWHIPKLKFHAALREAPAEASAAAPSASAEPAPGTPTEPAPVAEEDATKKEKQLRSELIAKLEKLREALKENETPSSNALDTEIDKLLGLLQAKLDQATSAENP